MAKIDKSLSVAQLLILSTAAARPDRMILPLPSTLRARGASLQRLLTSLLKLMLIEEVLTGTLGLSWRQDDQGQHYALRLTEEGATGTSVQSEQPAPDPISEAPEATIPPTDLPPPAAPPSNDNAPPGGKLGQVLIAVATPIGATLDELVTLTGWLPHTTRAALTRLKQRGYPVALVKQPDRKAYQLSQSNGA